MRRRVGVMGGTFDPVHIGHLRAAEECLEELGLEVVLFVPAADPPHKVVPKVLPFEHRWRMLELAVAGNPGFCLSDVERERPGKSYTFHMLTRLREKGPYCDADLFFLVGLDAFLELDTWYRYKDLFRLAHMGVMRRPGYPDDDVARFLREKVSPLYAESPGRGVFYHPELFAVHTVRNSHLEISSTHIRRLAAAGKSVRYLVLPEVMGYISDNCLYHWEYPSLDKKGDSREDVRTQGSGECGGDV